MHPLLSCAAGVIFFSWSAFASAQTGSAWPTRPIVIVTPTAGGAADAIARIVTAEMAKTLKSGFVVEARSGAGGNIASESVARAPADGYTLLLALGSMLTINPTLYDKVGFDPVKDFQPVALLATAPYVLVVNPAVPANSVREFADVVRARPRQFFYSSPGNGTPNHFLGALFNSAAGVELEHVPYRTTTGATTDVVAGQVQATFGSMAGLMPFVKSGKLRALGVTSEKRSALAPQLPTIGETLPGYGFQSWYALLAPAHTPKPIVDKLAASVAAALASSEVREKLAGQGAEVGTGTPQKLADLIRSDLARWSVIVKASGVRVN